MLGNTQMFKQFPLGECVILNIAAVVDLLWFMHLEHIKATNSLSLCLNPLTFKIEFNDFVGLKLVVP